MVRYEYAGDQNFGGAEGTGGLAISTAVVPRYNTMKAIRAGKASVIKFSVADASGRSLASPGLTVRAMQIVGAQGTRYSTNARGNANLDGVFRRNRSRYKYRLDTHGLAPGRYSLRVTIGNDPVRHALEVVVK